MVPGLYTNSDHVLTVLRCLDMSFTDGYGAEDHQVRVLCLLADGTVWLADAQVLAEGRPVMCMAPGLYEHRDVGVVLTVLQYLGPTRMGLVRVVAMDSGCSSPRPVILDPRVWRRIDL